MKTHSEALETPTDPRGSAAFPLPRGQRFTVAGPFLASGSAGILAGGVVAAVTGPTGFERGSWVAAYLVLVVGVAQVVLGAGLAGLPVDARTGRARLPYLLGWNLGSAAVVAGTLASAPVLTSAGGLVLAIVLVAAIVAVGDSRPELVGWAWSYRALAVFVLLSTPVGLLLAWLRSG